MREVIKVNENDSRYTTIIEEVTKAMKKENLIVIARSYKNRKSDEIRPFKIKNGLFFYVAYKHGEDLVFPGTYTAEDVYTAKANTVKSAVFIDLFSLIMNGDRKLKSLADWDFAEPMNVITTKESENGAGILACEEFLKAIHDKVGGYKILPSSIHEIIIVPDYFNMSGEDLTGIVRSVNSENCINDEVYLADRAFDVTEWID